MSSFHVQLAVLALVSVTCDALAAETNLRHSVRVYEETNLCSDGKLLPKLYLLGAQKAGTTSLAYKLMQSGVETAVREYVPDGKEWHFFDRRIRGQDEENIAEMKDDWLQQLPDCHDDDELRMLADFTIINLGLVPLPRGNNVTGTHWGWWFRKKHPIEVDVNLPWVLSKMYGPALIPSLRFVALIRSPVARMQSAWYHARAGGWNGVCLDCRSDTFSGALEETMAAFQAEPPVVKDWLWHSMYARQLEHWRMYYDANQFMIALFEETNSESMSSNCNKVTMWAGFPAACDVADFQADIHQNSNPHGGLDSEEIDNPELFQRFDAMMEPELQNLAQICADGHKSGMRLQGFDGPKGDVAAVRQWIEAGW